jgi:prophage regulatory protein
MRPPVPPAGVGFGVPSESTGFSPIDRIIMAAERRLLVPYSDMHIYRMEKAGKFPQRIKLGPNRVGWSLQEVTDWIDARKAERQAV